LLLALQELKAEGLSFDILYSRWPFFLRGSQADINRWYASMGLPNDAPRWMVAQKKKWHRTEHYLGALFDQAGLSPRNQEVMETKIWTETMTAHRLSQYAATESSDKCELFWKALSRRWHEGKDTQTVPPAFNNKDLLMECVAVAGLDLQRARQVLDGNAFEQEVFDMVAQVHAAGYNSIPILVFEVDGLVQGSWLTGRANRFRKVHHGSGDKNSFRSVLEQLHKACQSVN